MSTTDLLASLPALDKLARAYIAANSAIRAEQGFKVGDQVRIKGGPQSDTLGTITGVSDLGLWQLRLWGGLTYVMQNNRGLELYAEPDMAHA